MRLRRHKAGGIQAPGPSDGEVNCPARLILHNLSAGRLIDMADAAALLWANRASMDFAYLRHWAERKGLDADLARIWQEALPGETM